MATNKTCLGRLTENIRVICSVPQHGIAEMLLADMADVDVIVDDGNEVSEITFGGMGGTGKPVLVETYKLTAQAVEALRALDGGAALQQTISFTIYDKNKFGSIVSTLMNKRFIVLAKFKEVGLYKVYGAHCGLEIASSDSDSNDAGGFFKVSITTPEGAQGEASLAISAALYEKCKALIPNI